MAQLEITGHRDACYSAWHRMPSTKRFVGLKDARALGMIDIDAALYIEYNDGTHGPLALVETALDSNWHKSTTVLVRLAQRCSPPLPAFLVLYTKSDQPNPANPAVADIAAFRVRRVWPNPEPTFTALTPQEWAVRLVNLRRAAKWNPITLAVRSGDLTGGR